MTPPAEGTLCAAFNSHQRTQKKMEEAQRKRSIVFFALSCSYSFQEVRRLSACCGISRRGPCALHSIATKEHKERKKREVAAQEVYCALLRLFFSGGAVIFGSLRNFAEGTLCAAFNSH